jgi:hypothetical protein
MPDAFPAISNDLGLLHVPKRSQCEVGDATSLVNRGHRDLECFRSKRMLKNPAMPPFGREVQNLGQETDRGSTGEHEHATNRNVADTAGKNHWALSSEIDGSSTFAAWYESWQRIQGAAKCGMGLRGKIAGRTSTLARAESWDWTIQAHLIL